MEEAQTQEQRANFPISDAVLVATSNRAMVATNNYPDKSKSWNKMSLSEHTWSKWKPTYKEAYTASQRSAVVRAEKGTPLGGLKTNPGSGKEKNPGGLKHNGTPNNEMIDSLAGYLDNMVAMAMNGGSTFKQYTTNFTKIVKKNTTLANTIDKKQKDLTELRCKNNSLKNKLSTAAEPGGGESERKSVGVRNADLPGCGPGSRWVKGAY